MNVKSFLSKDCTLYSEHLSSKKRVLEQISAMAYDRIRPDENSEISESLIFEKLVAREKIGSTGLGQGVAIPHARLPDIPDVIGVFILLNEPIDFQSPDHKPVDLFFGLLVPEEANDQHLQILARLATLFKDGDFRERLRNAKHSATLFDTIAEEASCH